MMRRLPCLPQIEPSMKLHSPSTTAQIASLLGLLGILLGHGIAEAQTVDFQRDVQPILAEHCTQCHGGDEATRQAGLRLDVREIALKGGDSGTPAIVPGKPDMSDLIRRIM